MFGSTEASSSVSEEDPSSVLDSSEDDSLPLFQAVELDHLLWEWPWATSDVASQVWDTLSRKATVTEHYDLFLSHAWETNSLLKIAALAVRYNTERAVVLTWLVCWFLCRYCRLQVHLCVIMSCIILFSCLRLGRISSSCRVFFDRCCIPQDDPREKAKCIQAIPEYLACSKRFVSMWDESCQSRLWCMFELAIFVKGHGLDKVEIWTLRSIEFAAFFFTTSLAFWIGHDLLDDCVPTIVIDALFSILNTSYVIYYFHPICEGYWKGGIVNRVGKLKCSLQSDQDALLAHIRELHGSYRNFDKYVAPLAKALSGNLGGIPFALRLTIVSIIPSTLTAFITGRFATAVVVAVFPDVVCGAIALFPSCRALRLCPWHSRHHRLSGGVLAAACLTALIHFVRSREAQPSFQGHDDDLHFFMALSQIFVSISIISVLTRLAFAME